MLYRGIARMLYFKVDDQGAPVENPIGYEELRKKLSNISLSLNPTDEQLAPYNYVCLPPTADLPPKVSYRETWRHGLPIKLPDGTWKRTFIVMPMPEFEREKRFNTLRQTRDRKLAETDWTQLVDVQANMTDLQRRAWQEYRQDLRDLPNQADLNFHYIKWPPKPEA